MGNNESRSRERRRAQGIWKNKAGKRLVGRNHLVNMGSRGLRTAWEITEEEEKLKAGSSKKVEGPRLHLLHSVAEGLPEMTYPASEEPNTERRII